MKVTSKLLPHYDESGYDRMLVNNSYGLFGIFDGMGVNEDSRWVAETVSKYVGQQADNIIHSAQTLAMLLDTAKKMAKEKPHGGTTATIVCVDQMGTLHYAHAGDSRLYVMNEGRIKQVTADEGIVNILYNYIGFYGKGCCQLGSIKNWNKFMMCSDGVTGDTDEQAIADKDIEMILNLSLEPKLAMEKILNLSKKDDDKSIIVAYRD